MQDDAAVDIDDRSAPPRAPLRVMQILGELAKRPEGASLVQLSDELKLPKTSTFSLLRSLDAAKYIISENGVHRLHHEAFALASAILHEGGLAGRLRPFLSELQSRSDETAMLAVPASDWSHLIFADVIESASALRFIQRVGAQRPLYATSVGLALLAFASPEHQKRYLAETKLEQLTPNTITSLAKLRKLLTTVRETGYATASGSVLGLAGVSAPIFGSQGQVVASVGVAGPSTRIESRTDELVELVLATGARMSQNLGHAPAS